MGRVLPRTLIEHIPQQMRRSYDRIAPKYDRLRRPKYRWEFRLFDRLEKLMPAGGRLLDLGCGVGINLNRFRDHGFRVGGIDQSPMMVRFARRRNPGAPIHVRDMRRPGFSAGQFDAILSTFALIHVPQADQPQVFRHMHRLLKPGGHALFNIGAGAYEYIGEHYGEWLYWSGASLPESRRRLRKAGLTILWHRGLGPRGDFHQWVLCRKPGRAGR